MTWAHHRTGHGFAKWGVLLINRFQRSGFACGRALAQRPRFKLHFTPTSASWLNLVGRFFRDLSQDVVTPGSFASVNELVAAIWSYLTARNLKPQRYEWRADGQAILEKIRRAREALARQTPVIKDT